jgi:uncharacterized protein YciI
MGLLLRGPRVTHTARLSLAPAPGRHRPAGWRSLAVSASASLGGPEYLVLDYDYTHHDAELIAKREPYLKDHLRLCRQAADAGKLLLWGAVGNPIDSGMLIWRGADEEEVRSFIKQDPFVTNGLVRHWRIRPFHVHVVDRE